LDLIQTLFNAAVLGAVGLVLGAMLRGVRADLTEFKHEARADFVAVRGEIRDVRKDVAGLRSDTRADLAEVRREIGELRADLTRVALAVGAQPRAADAS
jgi:hypothetical protein